MAVEIPVFVDIEGAFKDAASRVPEAIKPLQKFLDSDSNALAIRLSIDEKNKITLKQILEDATLSAKNLKTALADAYSWLGKRAAEGGLDLSRGLTESEKIHLQALGALEYKINGINDASRMMGVVYSANIDRAQAKVAELMIKIDDLTRKQNKYNMLSKKNAPGARLNYANTTKQIDATRAELEAARMNLGSLTIELDKITAGGKRAAASVGMIKTPAMQMADEFRRGAAYVERWNASLSTANSRLAMLVKSSVSLIALHSATTFIRNVRQVTSEFEMQRVALGGIIHDTEQAEKLFKQIKAAAIQSPFEIKDLVSFTKQLSAYRIETENLFDVTMRLADVSAGLGVDMSRLVLAYGQVRAASVLRGQELRQFTEAGIPLVELLAEKFEELGRKGTTTADVFELISKRAVPFRMIEEIFNDMTSAGGMFYKMQEKQAETLKGQWMKLRDALSIMYDEIGNTDQVHGAMEALLKDAMQLMQNWREVGKNVMVVVAAMAAYKVAIANARVAHNALTASEVAEISALQLNQVARSRLIAAIFGEVAATKVQIAIGNAYVAVKKKEMMATNLFTKSLYRMIAALLANPYALAIAGIAALVAVLVKLSSKAKEAAITNEDLQKTIQKFNKADEHAKDIDKLCEKYDNLKDKVNKTKKEEEELARVTKELAKAYPSAITGANEHAKAINLDTQAIRERNEAVRTAIRLALEQDKNRSEKRVNDLQNEYNRISEILERGTIQKGAYGGTWYEPITDKQREEYGRRLIELESQISEFGESVDEASKKLEGFQDGFIGPPLPDFFDDAWRFKMNQYAVTLESTGEKTSAFTKVQIENFSDARDALNETAKEYKAQTELVNFYKNAVEKATGALKEQMQAKLNDAIAMQALYGQILTDFNAWSLVKEPKTSSHYQQDPFINKMQERIKFMQDFEKGYKKLSEYMTGESALDKQFAIMEKRGMSLGLDATEQKRAAKELSKWYEDMRAQAFAEVQKKFGVNGSIDDFLRQEINDTSNRGKALKDFQKLIQSLWDAQTDLDTSNMQREMEEAFKKLENDIKRSETARNFYKNIMDITGDEDLATTMSVSVYGDIGDEFNDRMQKQLDAAFQSLDWTSLSDELFGQLNVAFVNRDFDTILEHIELFPEKWQEAIKRMAEDSEKHSAELMKNFADLIAKYGDTAQKIATIRAKADNEIKKVKDALNESLTDVSLTPEQKKALESRAAEIIKALEANRDLDIFKQSDDYIKFFAEINVMTAEQAAKVRGELRNAYLKAFQEGAISADELRKNLRAIDEQFRKLSESTTLFGAYLNGGIDAANKKLQEYSDNVTVLAAKMKSGKGLDESEQAFASKMLKMFGSGSTEGITSYEQLIGAFSNSGGLEAAGEAFGQMGEGMSAMAANGPGALAIVDAIIKAVNSTIVGIQQIIDQLNEVRGEDKKIGKWFRFLGDFNKYAFSGWEKLKSGDVIGAFVDTISSIISIFNNIQRVKIDKINKEIEEQADLVKDLEYSYSRLEKVIAESFGSEYIYNYNKQLEILKAKAEAYQKQADLERSKGKSADEEVAKGYEESARDIQDQISDMQGQLKEFFAGTDLYSAAEDFANAWIDAYKEFGSTTDAMSEKFNDMINSMINRSLAAKIMQEMLQPVFDQIDTMARDGLLSTEEIGSIAALAQERIPMINDAMTNLMASLAAAGLDVRTSTAGFKGISKSIAGASEESILGLAAAVNTQNFYMSYVPIINENVAAILSAMTGGAVTGSGVNLETTENGEVMPSVQKMIYDHLPLMDQNLAELLRLVRSVITTKNGSTNTNYVAVK